MRFGSSGLRSTKGGLASGGCPGKLVPRVRLGSDRSVADENRPEGRLSCEISWSRHSDLNRGPAVYEIRGSICLQILHSQSRRPADWLLTQRIWRSVWR